ncbi:MAG TPA: hypothetical protein VHN14_13440 [Kofleriaceae bacterium]|jgi:hypothetical protein|nr:hypothetical protein [Kofleriaceae bacterium]
MIASWRGLVVAAALAVVLAVIVVLDRGRTSGAVAGAVDRALVPGFDPDQVTELVWERAGQPAIHVVRSGDGWETRAPSRMDPDAVSHVPVDPGAVGDVLAALRGARWHRRGAPVPVRVRVTVVAGAGRHELGIGAPIAGTGQIWITGDGRGMIVDGWVARALERDLLALRIKAPLADVGRAQTITVEGELATGGEAPLQIAGQPRRLAGRGGFVIAAELAGELERALAGITIVRVPDGPVAARGLAITTTGEASPPAARAAIHVMIGGSCPGAGTLVAMTGTTGGGCIEPEVVAAVERAIGRLLQPPEAVVERRPIPFEPTRVVLADAVALDTTALRIGDHPAEPARAAELLAALAAPAQVVSLPALPVKGTLVVTGRIGAAITLDLFATHVLARHGEPVALRPAPGAWNLLVRRSRELRDPTLWLEEPTTISAVLIDGVRYERGGVIGDWTRQPASGSGAPGTSPGPGLVPVPGPAPGPVPVIDERNLEALVGLLAAPRSLGFLDEAVRVAHRVALTITPPAGPPTERVLAIGDARAAGCPARVDRDTILLPVTVCAQIVAITGAGTARE